MIRLIVVVDRVEKSLKLNLIPQTTNVPAMGMLSDYSRTAGDDQIRIGKEFLHTQVEEGKLKIKCKK